MITYMDITFCPQKDCKMFRTCFRALTTAVKTKAEKDELPLSVFMSKPDCYKEDE